MSKARKRLPLDGPGWMPLESAWEIVKQQSGSLAAARGRVLARLKAGDLPSMRQLSGLTGPNVIYSAPVRELLDNEFWNSHSIMVRSELTIISRKPVVRDFQVFVWGPVFEKIWPPRGEPEPPVYAEIRKIVARKWSLRRRARWPSEHVSAKTILGHVNDQLEEPISRWTLVRALGPRRSKD